MACSRGDIAPRGTEGPTPHRHMAKQVDLFSLRGKLQRKLCFESLAICMNVNCAILWPATEVILHFVALKDPFHWHTAKQVDLFSLRGRRSFAMSHWPCASM